MNHDHDTSEVPESDRSCCGAKTSHDPNMVGLTCGGLWVRGALVCAKCGQMFLSPASKPCDAPVWTISGGGRSVDIGTGRLRFGAVKVETGERLDVRGLMARIARLPDIEREVVELRAALALARSSREVAA